MAHYEYVKGVVFEVLAVHQDRPQTMAHVQHVSNGVTYEARGWTRWDGKDEWSNGRGYNIAIKRARRKIAARLEWEANAEKRKVEAIARCDEADTELSTVLAGSIRLFQLHRDGGTVNL